jgi:hypothetical protein
MMPAGSAAEAKVTALRPRASRAPEATDRRMRAENVMVMNFGF